MPRRRRNLKGPRSMTGFDPAREIKVWCHNYALESSTFFSLEFNSIERRSPGLKGNCESLATSVGMYTKYLSYFFPPVWVGLLTNLPLAFSAI